jgi:hypothetical protein
VAYAKQSPGKLSFASSASDSSLPVNVYKLLPHQHAARPLQRCGPAVLDLRAAT